MLTPCTLRYFLLEGYSIVVARQIRRDHTSQVPLVPQSRKYHTHSRGSCSPVATTATPACTTDHDSFSAILHHFAQLLFEHQSLLESSKELMITINSRHARHSYVYQPDARLLCRLSCGILEYIHPWSSMHAGLFNFYSRVMYWFPGISYKLKREDQDLVTWRLLNFTHHHIVTWW